MYKNFEHGRSMIEMLGVLAIIGVLSVGALLVIQRRWNCGKSVGRKNN